MDLQNLNKDKKQHRPAPVSMETLVYGKVPPQDVPSEKAVLGAILLERHALAEVQDLLTPEKFYMEAHQRIYKAALSLDGRSQPIDEITMVMELKRREELDLVGGPFYVTELTKNMVSSANILAHARIIAETWMARQVIVAGGEMVRDGYETGTDAFDLVDRAEASIARIMDSNDRGKITPIDSALAKFATRLAHLRTLDSSMTGIPSGFDSLDKITHGWQDTDLIILAARPAVGKTAFALNLMRHAAVKAAKPVPTAFFSLEMSQGQLMERMVSAESEIFLEKIKTGQLNDFEMEHLYRKGITTLANAPIFIDDTPALNIFELRAKCRRLKNKHKIGFIIIDYLQLMSGTGEGKNGNREQEISRISRDLKGLAKELQVPIIALSQLSRAVESRKETDRVPQLSDLRESGAIEQDADMVMFLYRPEYYGIVADEAGNSSKGETHVKIAKHRNGSLDTVKLTAQLHIQKFVDYEGQPFEAPKQTSSWKPVRTPYIDKDDMI